MKAIVSLFLLIAHAQSQCMYHDAGGTNYTLNLTGVSSWTFENEESSFFYYYTPCRNGLSCLQGNARFASNAIQVRQGENECYHYLSVDHHQSPTYSFTSASWIFNYEDGELCDTTQQPRSAYIIWQCEENGPNEGVLYNVEEPNPCAYVYTLRSQKACVPESQHNANCQWRVSNGTGGYYYLDLSTMKNVTLYGYDGNGYANYYTPCGNRLNCYQQSGGRTVMTSIENRMTGTCEHYGAIWEDGRQQPSVHNVGSNQEHWYFRYFTGEKCSDGTDNFQEIRWYCDTDVSTYKVINATVEGDCRFYINLASTHACV
jgi:hypothetical protein